MADDNTTRGEDKTPLRKSTWLERIGELARAVLRGEGLTDYQIDALLNRPRAPHRDRIGPED